MKKNLLTIAATGAAVCMALTACGGSAASEVPAKSESTATFAAGSTSTADENGNAILDEIRAANQLDDMLTANGKVGVVDTFMDADGSVEVENTEVFVSGENGAEFYMHTQLDEAVTQFAYKAAGSNPFAGYTSVEEERSMVLIDPAISEELLDFYYTMEPYCTETVTETGEQDGILMVVVENTQDGEKVADTVYCVEPDTLRLVTINRTYVQDGETASSNRFIYTYGDDVSEYLIGDPSEEIVNASDACELAVTYHPGKSNEFTANYTAAQGTYITAYGNQGVAYFDEDLSTPAYGLTTEGDSMTLYVE